MGKYCWLAPSPRAPKRTRCTARAAAGPGSWGAARRRRRRCVPPATAGATPSAGAARQTACPRPRAAPSWRPALRQGGFQGRTSSRQAAVNDGKFRAQEAVGKPLLLGTARPTMCGPRSFPEHAAGAPVLTSPLVQAKRSSTWRAGGGSERNSATAAYGCANSASIWGPDSSVKKVVSDMAGTGAWGRRTAGSRGEPWWQSCGPLGGPGARLLDHPYCCCSWRRWDGQGRPQRAERNSGATERLPGTCLAARLVNDR